MDWRQNSVDLAGDAQDFFDFLENFLAYLESPSQLHVTGISTVSPLAKKREN
jgi:hypothetical protein